MTERRFDSRACIFTAVIVVAAYLGGVAPALAIPSPELIVGSFTSISQLVALLSAMLAGGAAVIGVRTRSSGNESSARRMWSFAVVAVVLLALSLGANLYQFWSARAQLQERLEATLRRPTPTMDGRTLDPTLKEVSYIEQLNSPRGISTEETERLLEATLRGERSDIIFLDIREPAETEMGGLPLSRPIRFPDLPKHNLDFSGKTAILLCHNGNRSYETCAALAAKGIDCRFMVGGLEKWLVEGRSLTGLNARTLADLRAVPRYRNQTVLLGTSEVHKAVLEEGAIFVDVRYPGEFAIHHLPGAINLPIRPTPTEQLRERISLLPHRPIIAPCYDRRSCFFGEILGLELERAGYDFRGRYTLPWEYLTAPQPRPYIEQWLKEAQKTHWDRLVQIVATVLGLTAQHIGIPAAILLLAMLSRLLILPFSVKAERDQIRARAASAELEALKLRLKNDPVRLTRAIRAFYRRHGLTPLCNLVALLFLPIMAIALLAVQQVTAKGGGHFLWVTDLAGRDPSLVLPILFAILICVYADMAFARNSRQRFMIWIAGVPTLTATGALFSAGADTYLVSSAALLLVQRMAVAGHIGRLWRMWKRLRLPADVITLDEPVRLPDYGNKALRLAQMRAQGMPVPNGVVLPPDFIEALGSGSAARRRQLDAIWRQLGSERVVVRSSATAEDGAQRSFAGVFESILNVDRGGLEAAIAKVKASFTSERASAYAASGGKASMLVQRMIAAEYAGVLFTQDPSAGGLAMIELVRGTAENLVSGAAHPQTYQFGRVSGDLFGEEPPSIDLKPLLALGRQAETLFGAPQDIEWTWQNDQFYLVQSRNITSQISAVQRSLFRALESAKTSALEDIAFAKNELSEMLPRPTPLSLSLMESLWASGGSVDLACRSLGFSYLVEDDSPNYLVAILGRLYLNKAQEQARTLQIGPLAARRLARGADRIEYHFRDTFLPKFLGEVRIAEATDFEKLSTPDLFDALERLRDRFVHETHVEADVINIAANFYLTRAREILARHGVDPSDYMGHIPETDEARAIAEVAHASREEQRSLLTASIGHRAVLDYELSEPRYSENPQALDERPARHAPVTHGPRAGAAAEETVLAGVDKAAIAAVATARRFQALKEDARHHSLRELALLRRIILALDRRLELDGMSFFLSFDELLGLRSQPAEVVREVAHERQRERTQLLDHESPPATLTVRDLEIISMGGHAIHNAASGLIRGTHVSGSGTVTGRARVLTEADAESGRPIGRFENGDIIVAPMIHPAWLPYFGRAGGFVCEIGGWLSHTAILAREYNTTMIVGTRGLNAIADGSLLRLHPDGGVETLREDELARAMAAE